MFWLRNKKNKFLVHTLKGLCSPLAEVFRENLLLCFDGHGWCGCLCFVSFSHRVMSWFAVFDCDISRSYALTFS